jgi:hypothetical protein
MSEALEPDPLDPLRTANPVRADDLPAASLARVSASVQEHIVSEINNPSRFPPRRGPLAIVGGLTLVGALALAVLVGPGLGTAPSTPPPVAEVPSENPAAGGGAASCLVYDPANLPTFEVVFDGTVTAVEGDQVTFDVEQDFKGAGDSVTLTAPVVDPALVGPLPAFEVGGRYLVTAIDSTIQACGYTVDYDADIAAAWAAAFQ